MKKTSFTLIELLVVIAIIGILAALMLPAIVGAKGTVRAKECLAHLKGIGVAEQNYATSYKNNVIPIGYGGSQRALNTWWYGGSTDATATIWKAVVQGLGLTQEYGKGRAWVPRDYTCPDANVDALTPTDNSLPAYCMHMSYAFNASARTWSSKRGFYGNKIMKYQTPSMVMDCADAFFRTSNNLTTMEYSMSGYDAWENAGGNDAPGRPSYRHDDGMNAVFFDGHAEFVPYENAEKNRAFWGLDDLDE